MQKLDMKLFNVIDDEKIFSTLQESLQSKLFTRNYGISKFWKIDW